MRSSRRRRPSSKPIFQIERRQLILLGVLALFSVLMMFLVVPKTIANITRVDNPAMALRWDSGNGIAQSRYADALYVANPEKPDKGAIRSHALDAIRAEPLSPQAMRILAFLDDATPATAIARKRIGISDKLSRRDIGARLWMIEEAVQRDDLTAALNHYDIALRTSQDSTPLLLETLSNALADDRMIEPVGKIFAGNPPWFSEFYSGFLRSKNGPAQRNFVRILAANPKIVRNIPAPVRTLLLRPLVGNGQFAAATIYRQLLGDPAPKGQILVSPSFANISQYQPFDWDLTGDARGSVSIVGSGGFQIEVNDGVQVSIMRQLVRLPQGKYRLIAKGRNLAPDQGGNAYWLVQCARTPNAVVATLAFDPRSGDTQTIARDFAITQPRCDFAWVELMGSSNALRTSTYAGQFDSVSIQPIR